jgi:hypothetical protein
MGKQTFPSPDYLADFIVSTGLPSAQLRLEAQDDINSLPHNMAQVGITLTIQVSMEME